jgi:hypothetical protein
MQILLRLLDSKLTCIEPKSPSLFRSIARDVFHPQRLCPRQGFADFGYFIHFRYIGGKKWTDAEIVSTSRIRFDNQAISAIKI